MALDEHGNRHRGFDAAHFEKFAHGLFEVPGVSRDDLAGHEPWQPRNKADLDQGSAACIMEDGRHRHACRAPPVVTDDTPHVDSPGRIDRQQMHPIDIGGVTDILEHLRNRARHVARAQQFVRASGDGFKQDIALMNFEQGERSRQPLAIGSR